MKRPRLKSASSFTPRSEDDEEAENQPITRMLLDSKGRLCKSNLPKSLISLDLHYIRCMASLHASRSSTLFKPQKVSHPRQP